MVVESGIQLLPMTGEKVLFGLIPVFDGCNASFVHVQFQTGLAAAW